MMMTTISSHWFHRLRGAAGMSTPAAARIRRSRAARLAAAGVAAAAIIGGGVTPAAAGQVHHLTHHAHGHIMADGAWDPVPPTTSSVTGGSLSTNPRAF